jgi:hypothetical protein
VPSCYAACLSCVRLIAVPGGSIAVEGDKPYKTNACVFEAPEDMESMHSYEQVNFGLYVFCLVDGRLVRRPGGLVST